jgi:hypothetical protein
MFPESVLGGLPKPTHEADISGGYIAAFLMTSAAVAIRIASTNGPDALASSGMYAFGGTLLFVGVFGVCALAPTGAALFFLRPYRYFWAVFSALAPLGSRFSPQPRWR